MKDISTLIPDIYARLDSSEPFDEETVSQFAHALAKKLANRLSEIRGVTKLRLSNWASPCERQLYLTINQPETVEKLPANVRLKFLFGDISEEVLFFLARAAGHDVTGEQDTLEVGGVEGHRDGIIDGHLVDAKSASPYSFRKFAAHLRPEEDAFGYLGQLESYHTASRDDPKVLDKDRASFLVVDKVSGEICLDTHEFKRSKAEVASEIFDKRARLASDNLPRRAFAPEPMGKSGNMKLPINCSYCPVKDACYSGEIRTFIYSTGPVHLTHVADLPRVPEVTT